MKVSSENWRSLLSNCFPAIEDAGWSIEVAKRSTFIRKGDVVVKVYRHLGSESITFEYLKLGSVSISDKLVFRPDLTETKLLKSDRWYYFVDSDTLCDILKKLLFAIESGLDSVLSEVRIYADKYSGDKLTIGDVSDDLEECSAHATRLD